MEIFGIYMCAGVPSIRMVGTRSEVAAEVAESQPLDVRISVTPPNECTCPLLTQSADSVRRSSVGSSSPGTECRLVLATNEGSSFQTAKIGEQCICPVFDDHDCVWEMTEVTADLQVEVTVPDRSALASLMNELEATASAVELERISPTGHHDAGDLLTAKQREAFIAAVEAGYYERPRETSLEEIADELEISVSAVSQRLTATRRRVAKKYAPQIDANADHP